MSALLEVEVLYSSFSFFEKMVWKRCGSHSSADYFFWFGESVSLCTHATIYTYRGQVCGYLHYLCMV